MRTNIELDDKLIAEAKEISGLKTKRAVVEDALRKYISLGKQVRAWDALKGLADWEGDLDEIRHGGVTPTW